RMGIASRDPSRGTCPMDSTPPPSTEARIPTSEDAARPSHLANREIEAVKARRKRAGLSEGNPNADAIGLALSGGGIRSATFSVGVLQGLATLGLLKRIDYLSTVSGGGYCGSFLGRLFTRTDNPKYAELGSESSVPRPRAEQIEAELTD